MSSAPVTLPEHALLARYHTGHAFTDCYAATADRPVSLADYVTAFYTTPLFKLERRVLRVAGHPSSDADARALAHGDQARFAAWHVEDRTDDQLLVCDAGGRTRSWFMVDAQDSSISAAPSCRTRSTHRQ